MSGRGAQMAETLASLVPATAWFLWYSHFGGGNENLVRLVVDVSTLLGPEGTTVVVFSEPCRRAGARRGARHGLVSHTAGGTSGFGVGLWVVGWLFVENCTVDASIFVVKLSRANGGCLGTRSR